MSQFSLDEASGQLADLVARAQAGEEVVLTRDGVPVAELHPSKTAPKKPKQPVDIEWLRAHRVGRRLDVDAATLIRQMRDEDWA